MLPESEYPRVEHTAGHVNCPACDNLRVRILGPALFGMLRFIDAAPLWLEDHHSSISAKTYAGYQFYVRRLERFFGELELRAIHIGHIRGYQEERFHEAGASCINHEINVVKQVLGRAGLWSEIAKFYTPLPLGKSEVGCALDADEEQRLFAAAASNPRWKVAYWCSLVTATTGAGPGEIAHLHLDDVSLGEEATLRIRDGLKNVHRDRIVALNHTATWAIGQILKRYYRMCRRLKFAPCADHYILPGRARTAGYDPWRPMGSWKKAWRKLRIEAGLPNLRMYDLRHQAITKLLEEADVSEQTVEELVGHVSERMKKRYSHIRLRPKREAVAKLELPLPMPRRGQVVEIVETKENRDTTTLKPAPVAAHRF